MVTEATTHVVSGATRRTLNTLAATIRGCWVLSVEWVRGGGGEGRGRERGDQSDVGGAPGAAIPLFCSRCGRAWRLGSGWGRTLMR